MKNIGNVKVGHIEAIRSQVETLKEISKDGMYPDDLEWIITYEKSICGIEKYLSALEILCRNEEEQ